MLVVEDESSIASFVSLYLKNAGYGVRTASTGNEALAQVQAAAAGPDRARPDAPRHRRDRGLPADPQDLRRADPDADGAGRGRRQDHRPRGRRRRLPDEAVQPAGAGRPGRSRSSAARRRSGARSRASSSATATLLVDAGRREVRVGEEEIQLAPKEFDLLWELLDHRGLVLTRDQLLERVWGYTFAGDTRTVDVHVRQLRRKLGDASPIVTVWGVGYKVTPAKDAARLGERRCSGRCASACRRSSWRGSRSPGSSRRRSRCSSSRRTSARSRWPSSSGRRVGLTQLYQQAAIRSIDEGRSAPDFAAAELERATGARLYYVGAPVFFRHASGLRELTRAQVPDDWQTLVEGKKVVTFEFTPPGESKTFLAVGQPLELGGPDLRRADRRQEEDRPHPRLALAVRAAARRARRRPARRRRPRPATCRGGSPARCLPCPGAADRISGG